MRRALVLVAGVGMIGFGALAQTAPQAQSPPPPAPAAQPAPASPIRKLLDQDKYAEALAAAEAAIKADPASVDDQSYRIEALMGLGRDMEALRFAVPLAGQHPERPDLRYRVGQCAYAQGMFPQAIQAWAALYTCPDKEWAGRAVRQSARTLAIQGKELEARKLVNDMLARWPEPPLALLRYALEIDPSVAEGLKRADKAMALDPANKSEYESLKSIYSSAGEGELFQEAAAGRCAGHLQGQGEERDAAPDVVLLGQQRRGFDGGDHHLHTRRRARGAQREQGQAHALGLGV